MIEVVKIRRHDATRVIISYLIHSSCCMGPTRKTAVVESKKDLTKEEAYKYVTTGEITG